jgi:hypothetical protein
LVRRAFFVLDGRGLTRPLLEKDTQMTSSHTNEQKANEQQPETPNKKPYEPPAVQSEALFETAAGNPGKTAQDLGFTCDFVGS